MCVNYLHAGPQEAQMDGFVDTLIEDETERESLLAKPICFIIIGRPVTLMSFF